MQTGMALLECLYPKTTLFHELSYPTSQAIPINFKQRDRN